MIVLGIESSCDETAAALLEGRAGLLSSVVASQIGIHHPYGGVVPELASREHIDAICTVVEQALSEAGLSLNQIQGIAVTRGPGLVGALLVGLSYAKGLAFALGVPYVGVNHLEGHLCSIYLDHPGAELPALALVVSGGHTSLFLLTEKTETRLLARTRDDAAGEALDKLSKWVGLGYPGGPVIDRLAETGDPSAISFTLPRISDGSIDFSFSGIKTAAMRIFEALHLETLDLNSSADPDSIPSPLLDLLASYQASIVDQLLDRLQKAAEGRPVRSIQISGGVSRNRELRRRTRQQFSSQGLPVYFPRPELTTDNAAMIAAAGRIRLQAGGGDPWDLAADPHLLVGGKLGAQAP